MLSKGSTVMYMYIGLHIVYMYSHCITLFYSIIRRVGALLQRMSSEVSAECQRLGTWGVLGQGSGALLVTPGTEDTPIPRHELFGESAL